MLQFSAHEESLSDHFGPYALELTSNVRPGSVCLLLRISHLIPAEVLSRLPISQEFLVAGPFNASLTFAAPPPSLTIFAINAYLVQTTKIVSPKPGGRTAEFKCRKQYLVREGERDGYSYEMFASQTRKRGQLVFDGSKIGKPGGLKKGEMWTWSKFGRIVSPTFQLAETWTLIEIELTRLTASRIFDSLTRSTSDQQRCQGQVRRCASPPS